MFVWRSRSLFPLAEIRLTSSLKPARFEGTSGDPHCGTDRPVLLGNSDNNFRLSGIL